jgi:hypothetical protein
VRCAKVGSGDTVPFCIIPDLIEVRKHNVQSSSAKGRYVFDDNAFWFDFIYKSPIVFPMSRAFTLNTRSLTCVRDVLAREPASDHINICITCYTTVFRVKVAIVPFKLFDV